MDEEDLQSKHVRLNPRHLIFLKSIDEDCSKATRKALDQLIQQKNTTIVNEYLTIFAVGILILSISALTSYLYSLFLLLLGALFMMYSTGMIIYWRYKGNALVSKRGRRSTTRETY